MARLTDQELQMLAQQIKSNPQLKSEFDSKYSAMQQNPSALNVGAGMLSGALQGFGGKVPEATKQTGTDEYSKALQKLELERKYKEAYPTSSERLSQIELEEIERKRKEGASTAQPMSIPSIKPTTMPQETAPEEQTSPEEQSPPMYINVPQGADKYGAMQYKTEKNPEYEQWVKKQENKEAREKETAMVIDTADEMLNTLGKVKEGIDYFGVGGAIPAIPGIQSNKLKWQAYVDQLLAKNVVNLMNAMKSASRTGATGFGQLSEKELKVLQDASTALKKVMSPEDAMEILNNMEEKLKKVLAGQQTTDNQEIKTIYVD